jgi:hypothetical protein
MVGLALGLLGCVGFTAAMMSGGLREALLFTVASVPAVAILAALYGWRMRRRNTGGSPP